jgi:hypothetical protein
MEFCSCVLQHECPCGTAQHHGQRRALYICDTQDTYSCDHVHMNHLQGPALHTSHASSAFTLCHVLQVLSMVSIVDERMKEQMVESDELLAIYEQVKESFPEEYIMFDCPAIAVYQLLPRMVPDLASWDVLQAPLQWLPSFSAWKRLLKTQNAPTSEELTSEPSPSDPFTELVLQALYPPLRAAIMTAWDPFHPVSLLQFFDHWTPVLPPSVSRNLLHTMVLPRVRDCVHRWSAVPASGPPAHLWLHPWLPFMATELQDLYPLVRKAMTQILLVRSPCTETSLNSLLSLCTDL